MSVNHAGLTVTITETAIIEAVDDTPLTGRSRLRVTIGTIGLAMVIATTMRVDGGMRDSRLGSMTAAVTISSRIIGVREIRLSD